MNPQLSGEVFVVERHASRYYDTSSRPVGHVLEPAAVSWGLASGRSNHGGQAQKPNIEGCHNNSGGIIILKRIILSECCRGAQTVVPRPLHHGRLQQSSGACRNVKHNLGREMLQQSTPKFNRLALIPN